MRHEDEVIEKLIESQLKRRRYGVVCCPLVSRYSRFGIEAAIAYRILFFFFFLEVTTKYTSRYSEASFLERKDIHTLHLGHISRLSYTNSTMDPYDSDSSLEDEDFTETATLLGYPSEELIEDTISHLGGWPVRGFTLRTSKIE